MNYKLTYLVIVNMRPLKNAYKFSQFTKTCFRFSQFTKTIHKSPHNLVGLTSSSKNH